MIIPVENSSIYNEPIDEIYSNKDYTNKANITYSYTIDKKRNNTIRQIWSSFFYNYELSNQTSIIFKANGFNRDSIGRNQMIIGLRKKFFNEHLHFDIMNSFSGGKGYLSPIIKTKVNLNRIGDIKVKKIFKNYALSYKKNLDEYHSIKATIYDNRTCIGKGKILSKEKKIKNFGFQIENVDIISYKQRFGFLFKNNIHCNINKNYSILCGFGFSDYLYSFDIGISISSFSFRIPLLVLPSNYIYKTSMPKTILYFFLSKVVFFSSSKVLSSLHSYFHSKDIIDTYDTIKSQIEIQNLLSKQVATIKMTKIKINYALYGKYQTLLKYKNISNIDLSSFNISTFISDEFINVTNSIILLINNDSLSLGSNKENYIGFINPLRSITDVPYLLISYTKDSQDYISIHSSNSIVNIN